MPRLPKPGSDQGKWGEILNDYLSQSHTDTGTLKDNTIGTNQIQDNSVTTAKLQDNSVTTAKIIGVGQANGIATLDTNGKLSESQVPERLGEDELNTVVCRSYADLSVLGALPEADDAGLAYGSRFSGEGQWVVSGGLDISAGIAAGYLETDPGGAVGLLGADIIWDSNDGALVGAGGTIALVSWADGGVATSGLGRRTSCHLTLTSVGVLQYWVREQVGGTLTPIWATTIPAMVGDGSTVHRVEVLVGPGRALVSVDEYLTLITDSRIALHDGETFACWEPYYATPATDVRCRIQRHWAALRSTAPGGLGDRLIAQVGALAASRQPVVVGKITPEVAVTIPADPNSASGWVVLSAAACAVQAGDSGTIVWDIEVPVAQTAGDGEVGAGSLWVGVCPLAGTQPISGHRARAAWVQTTGVIRRRVVTTGHTPGQIITRAPAVSKDTGGSGVSTVTALRHIVMTATAV